MQLARKNDTSESFVVYGFYEMLDKEVKRLGIADKPECFYNCDESGFPTDPYQGVNILVQLVKKQLSHTWFKS